MFGSRRSSLPEVNETEWRSFAGLPGLHLSLRRNTGRFDLVLPSGEIVASCQRGNFGSRNSIIQAQGKTYGWRRIGGWKQFGAGGSSRIFELWDLATNEPLLRQISTHHNFIADSRVIVGQHTLTFPVIGRRRERSLMSAVDESGTGLIQYRFERPKPVEMVIRPAAQTIPGVEILAAVSSTYLPSYFETGGGGGG
jgi:hypothetical protein